MKLLVVLLGLFALARAGDYLECSSSVGDNKPTECRYTAQEGFLIQKISGIKELYSAEGSCVEGVTYGIVKMERAIWVSNGCSALFVIRLTPQRYERTCSADGEKLQAFNGKRKEDTYLPCKYYAIRNQQCGKYKVLVSPTNVWRWPNYYVETIWLGVSWEENGVFKEWEGRTTNKKAAKYLVTGKEDLYTKKDLGPVQTSDIFEYSRTDKGTFISAKNGDFTLEFIPWDPENPRFKTAEWTFTCNATDWQPNPYEDQVCGGWKKTEVKDRATELGVYSKAAAIIHDVFSFEEIAQPEGKCDMTENVFVNECDAAEKVQAINMCGEIITSLSHTKCISKYSCDPMDVFHDCVKWVCNGMDKKAVECYNIGVATDMCASFNSPLDELVESANCYKDYYPLPGNLNVPV